MHGSAYSFIDRIAGELGIRELGTLEVGSLDVNGTVRPCFTGEYLGCDMRPGPGVDVVADAEQLPFDTGEWPTVVSTEMLEHCRRPWVAVPEMARVLAHGGHLLLTFRGFDQRGAFALHDHPADHWRLGPGATEVLLEDAGLEVGEVTADPECPGWLVYARKPEA